MLDTINYFCLYGKADLVSHPQLIQTTAKMAEIALFTTNPN